MAHGEFVYLHQSTNSLQLNSQHSIKGTQVELENIVMVACGRTPLSKNPRKNQRFSIIAQGGDHTIVIYS